MDKGRILIIDDNPKNIQVLAHVLYEAGYEVELGTSSYDAMNSLKEELFDLLMLDVMMPEVDGFETCRNIRLLNEHDNMPIIFISAKSDSQSMVEGFKAGGQDYVSKPFDKDELLARVNTQIELKRSKEELNNLNLELEQKVRERTNELYEINKIKDKYLSFIGGQLDTPLTSITKVLEVIKNSSESSMMAEMINLLSNSIKKLEDVAGMAQLMSSMENSINKLKIEEVSLLGFVENTLMSIHQYFNEKQIELIIDLDEDTNALINVEHCEQSILLTLKTLLNYIGENQIISFSSEESEEFIKLSIKASVTLSLDSEKMDYPEDILLNVAYSETFMAILGGNFSIAEENKVLTLEWYFKKNN